MCERCRCLRKNDSRCRIMSSFMSGNWRSAQPTGNCVQSAQERAFGQLELPYPTGACRATWKLPSFPAYEPRVGNPECNLLCEVRLHEVISRQRHPKSCQRGDNCRISRCRVHGRCTMEAVCHFVTTYHGRLGIFPGWSLSPCLCSSIIRELGKLYNTSRAYVA